ncbi:hypothetical protein P3S68_006982 [Capsicum galapagoense]
MNAIELLVKTYVVIDIDSSHRDVKKNENNGNDLRTPNEQPNDISEKNDDGNAEFTGDHKGDEKLSTESSLKLNFDNPAIPKETIEVQNIQEESGTEVKNVAFQHFIDNTIAEIFSPVSNTEISSDAFQESMDNIIAGMSTPVVAITLNLDDLSEKVNLPDPFL